MRRDPLVALIRLRKQACDEAQLHLVACLAAETRAESVAEQAERAIASETEAATDPRGSDAVVEAFAAWLPIARRQLEQARRELETLRAETARARAGLAASSAALESVETLRQRRREEAARAAERQWQRELEDRPPRATDDCSDSSEHEGP